MALTETPPATATPSTAPEPDPGFDPVSSLLASGDHKITGRLYLSFALVLLLAGVIVAAVLGIERLDQTGFQVFTQDTYFQVSTLSATGMVVMVLMPLVLGLGIYLVPLQLGARSIAFPRAAVLSFWGYLVGTAMVIASYGINGGPGGGDPEAVDLWLVSFGLLVASLLLGAICVVTTVIANRPPGMTLDRVPLFSWSMLVMGALWLLTLPVLLGVLLLAYVDHTYGRTFFGNVDIYFYVHWLLRTPQIYVLAIPALGIIGDIVPVMARRRQGRQTVVMAAIAAFGVLGFGAFSVGLFAPEVDIYAQWAWVAMGVAIVLPVLVLLGGWAETLVRGQVRVATPLLFALAGTLVLLAAATAGALLSIGPLELAGTTWATGQADLVLWGTVIAVVGGLHYWAPKIGGRFLSSGLGAATLGLLVLGTVLLAGGNLGAGIPDQVDHLLVAATPGFVGVVEVSGTVEFANGVALAGAGVLVLAVFLLLVNVVASSFSRPGPAVRADPWGGHTLEWATASPPPPGNFDEVALVTSAAPLLDERGDDADGADTDRKETE